ncbi:MAG: glycosyltransferase family 1 protein [Chloroflexi bacterium]|nr:MAG: glycosyltransferase family 1 protein [Chloroflexota bacterium]
MRIAYVTETWFPSVNGVVTRLAATVSELAHRGHEVLVVAPHVSGTGDWKEPPGATVRHVPSVGLPFIYGGQPWGLPLPRVVGLLDRFAPDLIHAVCPTVLGWAGVLQARFRGLPLVCSYHTHVARYAHYYHLGFAERPVWALIRRAHRHAHVNLAASEESRDELQAHGVRDVGVWRGGVDLGLFHPGHASDEMRTRLTAGHPERRLCIYVGRLAAEKGIDRLLPLAAPGGDRHLALVGDGPAMTGLRQAFTGMQATFPGRLAGRELAAAYASSDVFVFPSTTDTLGLVLLEAMASGLPVVAARSPSSRSLLDRAPAGGLFEPDDSAGLVATVRRWLGAPLDRRHLAEEARRTVFTWGRATSELLTEYERAIALAGRRAAA